MIEAEREGEASLDRALIERWRDGDERAATAIVERHASALARYAVRLGVTDDVEDVVQDTFIRAFAALDELGVPYDKVYVPQLRLTFDDAGAAGVPWTVAIERCVSQSRGHGVTRALEGFDVKVINPAHVIEVCGDKLATNEIGRASWRERVCSTV